MAAEVAQTSSYDNQNRFTFAQDEDQQQDAVEEPGGQASGSDEIVQYKDEFERVKSFPTRWECNISKRELTKCGFYFLKPSAAIVTRYYTESDRNVQCAFCCAIINLATVEGSLRDLHAPECEMLSDHQGSNIPLGDVTNFRYEKNRLITFLVVNWVAPVDPYDLAKSGFYFTGVADVARCNFCRLEVRGWEQGDIADGEHRRWNAGCAFLNSRQVGNVELGRENENHYDVICCQNHETQNSNNSIVERIKFTGTNKTSDLRELNVTVLNEDEPRHPNYKAIASRLSSYETWPSSLRQRPEDLAEAGFYYTGTGDRVICFQCGGGLKDWDETDKPWVEHAKWFPSCSYLLIKKGQSFVQNLEMSDDEEIETPKLAAHTPSYLPENPVSRQQHDQGAEYDSRLCIECNKNELGIVFLPCGHMVTCPECADKITESSRCSECKSKINAYVRAYLP